MIYTQVVRDTHRPRKKFAFFRVTATADGVDDLN